MKQELQTNDDILLINKINSGDRNAMQAFIKKWNSDLYKRIYFLTNQAEISRDICQEAWQSILKNIHKLKDTSKFKPWMMTIASRKAYDWIRSIKKFKYVPLDSISESELIHKTEDIAPKQLGDTIINGIRLLDPSQTIILELYYLKNMRLKQIALFLNIPQGTVKSRLFYAREELKRIIKKEVHDET